MSLEAEVTALAALDLEELRAAWRRRYGAPPKLRSPDLLRRWLAWRIQADALGGLDRETRRRLLGQSAAAPRLQPGVKLTREWKGAPCEVLITDAGFSWEGRPYRSLSEVARAVTGVRINGPRFFGLRSAS